jgi:hypothetical protein
MRNIVFGLIMAALTTLAAPVTAAPTTPDLACDKVFTIAEKSAEALIVAKTPSAKAHLSARLGRIWKREGVRCALPPIHRFIEGAKAARGERLVAEAMEEVQQLTDGLDALRGVFKDLSATEKRLTEEVVAAKAEAEEEDRKAEAAVAAAKEASAREKKMGLMRECYSPETCVAEAERLAVEVKKAEKPYDRLPLVKSYLAVMAKLEVMLK